MKKVGSILLMIVTLAITAVMIYLYAENSRRYAFGWGWTAVDIFLALPLIFVIATEVWMLRAPKGHKQYASISFIERKLGLRKVGPPALSVMIIIIVICLFCWLTALFFIYVADDVTRPAWDERSVPAARGY